MGKHTVPMWRNREVGGCAVSIEINSYCNLNCPECPRVLDPTRSRWKDGEPIREQMPTKKVYDLVDQVAEMGWRGHIHFSHYSEPLVDPRFVAFCKYAVKKGIVPELYTNGSLLTKELVKQIDGLVPRIVFSYRTPGSAQFWQSLFKKSRIGICDSFHVLIWNPHKGLLEKAIKRVRDKPCVGPLFTAFRINYDGQMSMCYADFNNEFGLLNAFDHSLEELWFGEEHAKAIREMSVLGSRMNRALCRQCPEVFPDGGFYVPVGKPDTPPQSWLRRLGVLNQG